jgi:hypothetical protein
VTGFRHPLECIAFVTVALLAQATAAAGGTVDTAALMAPVRTFAAAFNAQAAYPTAAFTPDCSVLDAFAPFAWTGARAPRRWFAGLVGATAQARRTIAATHQHVAFGAPQFARIDGARAYLVVPGAVTTVERGRSAVQRGRWVLVEARGAAGWRIASQAWDVTGD